MGTGKSKPAHSGKTLGAKSGPVQPSLPPQPPYNGLPIEYHHIIINATLDMNARMSFFRPDVTFSSTNIDSYYPMLAALYEQGYRMLVFVALPGSTKSFGFAAMGQAQMNVKFQGVFRKSFPEEASERWQLRVEKSILVNQMFMQWSGNLFLNTRSQTGSVSDGQHIFQTINNVTQSGGRIISVELTGMAGQELEIQRQMMQRQAHQQYWRTGTMPMMQVGVDVFYEVPLHPTDERYVYQIVSCPMISTFQQSFPHGQFVSVIDWQGVMTQYLGTGWKLVEIFEDYAVTSDIQQSGFTPSVNTNKNCLWIFEKRASRMSDNTPLYEGTMVEHYVETKTQIHAMGFGGVDVNVKTDWEPVIEHMGRYGWQVVRILQTPDAIIKGTFSPTILTRQMIFFQRRIAAAPAEGATFDGASGGAPPAPSAAPPSYNELYSEKPTS